ncbi:hypothetical protein [uncultured Treponema sp.]|uniref:hypothetical protein n=1 Tax=uncultured Treponema sp. TaxID=162155 RepID=UPI002596AF20|nr:hypothetical protein [uncultured Treponema sp.]
MLDFFEYKNHKYPYKTVYFSNFNCNYIIATEDFESQLLPDGETYHSKTAMEIDEKIFFYVPKEFFLMDDEYISKFIGESI